MDPWDLYADRALDLRKVKREHVERGRSLRPTACDVKPEPVSASLAQNGYYGLVLDYKVPPANNSPQSYQYVMPPAYSSPSERYHQVVPPANSSPIERYQYEVSPTNNSATGSSLYGQLSSPSASIDSCEVDSLSDDMEYQAFEKDALRAMAEKNGGLLLGSNPRMRRAVQASQTVDDSYRKQREKNNNAAKQSRDRRKLREVRLALHVAFLKKKIAELRLRGDRQLCAKCQQKRSR